MANLLKICDPWKDFQENSDSGREANGKGHRLTNEVRKSRIAGAQSKEQRAKGKEHRLTNEVRKSRIAGKQSRLDRG